MKRFGQTSVYLTAKDSHEFILRFKATTRDVWEEHTSIREGIRRNIY